jgi:hypothetical protein
MTSRKAYGNGILISRAKKKYGDGNFEVSVLATTEGKLTADYLERFFISVMGVLAPNGYNLALGGDGGSIHTPEIKAKVSALNYERYAADPSIKIRISQALKGRVSPRKGCVMSEDQKAKISKAGRGRVVSEETRAKCSALQKGIPKSEEAKARMKISAKLRANSEEGRARMRTASLRAAAIKRQGAMA